MTEATQLPADDVPEVGACYNYGGDNYVVTRVDPESFLVLGSSDCWTPAIAFTDKVGDGETATLEYVMSLADFVDCYESGEIVEGEAPEVDNELPDDDAPEATQLPADDPTAKPKG